MPYLGILIAISLQQAEGKVVNVHNAQIKCKTLSLTHPQNQMKTNYTNNISVINK